jgi:hypothetical protein
MTLSAWHMSGHDPVRFEWLGGDESRSFAAIHVPSALGVIVASTRAIAKGARHGVIESFRFLQIVCAEHYMSKYNPEPVIN